MQTLHVHEPGLPDLQFVLLVVALMTSGLDSLNVPEDVRETVFDRCWALLHDSPPPSRREERVLDLRFGDEVTLQALVEVIRRTFDEHGITCLTWDHPPSEPTQRTTPEAMPLVERLGKLYPFASSSDPFSDNGPPGETSSRS
ncbi:MAG: hypothetical protein D6690_09545 [Nitrospirae bacterium]|nr:MAG: hypothetical protein D6690_09545 [Nitrospirota bacterium]